MDGELMTTSLRCSSQDELLIRACHCFPGATYQLLAQLTGRSVDALRHRMARLEAADLVRSSEGRRGARPIVRWYATAHGIRAARMYFRAAVPNDADFAVENLEQIAACAQGHMTTVGRVRTGPRVVQTMETLAWTLLMRSDSDVRSMLHFPDLLLAFPTGRKCVFDYIAVEARVGLPQRSDWKQRLWVYDQLGIRQLVVFSDEALLRPTLTELGSTLDLRVVVHRR